MTVTLTNQSRHSVTPTNQTHGTGSYGAVGTSIGLLLALTYAAFAGILLTNQSRHATVPTNQTKS